MREQVGRADMGRALRLLTDAGPVAAHQLPGLVATAYAHLGADSAVVYLVDYTQMVLSPLPSPVDPGAARLPVEGTAAGRAFIRDRPAPALRHTHGHVWWLPVTNGADRLGVLQVRTTRPPTPQRRAQFASLAALVATLLAGVMRGTDTVERTRRLLPMQLAAEVLWNLLPPRTMRTDTTTVSAVLEPCYDIGGDAFDYAANGDILHVALFDTVGHGIDASATTSLTVNAYRNARRTGLTLPDTYLSIDKWLANQYPDGYVTAVLLELNTRSGVLRYINAGHPPTMLLRENTTVRPLPGPTALPLGLAHLSNRPATVETTSLKPGDCLLLYTDGIVEARDDNDHEFGVAGLTGHLTQALVRHLSPAETLRRLVQTILTHQNDQIRDDATAVLTCWHPPDADPSRPGQRPDDPVRDPV